MNNLELKLYQQKFLYEKICYYSEKILNAKPDEKTANSINKNIYTAHLNVTPTGVQSASALVSIVLVLFSLAILLLSTTIGTGLLLVSMMVYFLMQSIPKSLAKKMKNKANDQVIIAIFYIVAYMRFSSNFELAISFAANYLSPPLSLDFKRLLWQLENSEYPTIKAAFDNYLEDWREESLEFLEAIYLIESSLYESEEFRRISLLDKSLDIILEGNYEKMMHFSQELRGKVQTFNMIGVVLPILGLIILPLAAAFSDPSAVLQVVIVLYNVIIPASVAYFAFTIVYNKPSSVNSIKPSKQLKNKLRNLQMYPLKISKNKIILISPKIPAIIIFILFFSIGISPIIFHITGLDVQLTTSLTSIFPSGPFGEFQTYKDIEDSNGNLYNFGPYGFYSGILSLFIPLSFAFGIGYYLKYKYQNLTHIRDKTKELEKQFPAATFQLGNRINEGISAELAFGAVAETMKGTEAAKFFGVIDSNIKFSGMSIKNAIFDKEKGALNEYPSDLIMSSMKIFLRAVDNGPEITAKTLVDLSKYLSDIHRSNERMMDLLGESIGSMKSQASFLAPIISAVVISIVSLVTMILGHLAKETKKLTVDAGGNFGSFLGDSIPTFLFQSIVGIYLVMIIIILVYVVSNLENGDDPINTKYLMGKQLSAGITKYAIVVALGIYLFTLIGSKILPNLS